MLFYTIFFVVIIVYRPKFWINPQKIFGVVIKMVEQRSQMWACILCVPEGLNLFLVFFLSWVLLGVLSKDREGCLLYWRGRCHFYSYATFLTCVWKEKVPTLQLLNVRLVWTLLGTYKIPSSDLRLNNFPSQYITDYSIYYFISIVSTLFLCLGTWYLIYVCTFFCM